MASKIFKHVLEVKSNYKMIDKGDYIGVVDKTSDYYKAYNFEFDLLIAKKDKVIYNAKYDTDLDEILKVCEPVEDVELILKLC